MSGHQTTSKHPFTEKEWAFLAFLPFRIGLWIGDYDSGGGTRAETAELKALSDTIIKVQHKYQNNQFIQALAKQTESLVYNQHQQPHNLSTVLNDCKRAISLLKSHCEDAEVNCYKLLCVDVAEAVAKAASSRAFGAHNLQGGAEKGWLGLYPIIASLTRLGYGPKVSNAEKDAINALIDALGAGQIVNHWKKLS